MVCLPAASEEAASEEAAALEEALPPQAARLRAMVRPSIKATNFFISKTLLFLLWRLRLKQRAAEACPFALAPSDSAAPRRAFQRRTLIRCRPRVELSPSIAVYLFSVNEFLCFWSQFSRFAQTGLHCLPCFCAVSFGFPALAFPAAPFKTGKCGIWGFRPLLFDVKEAVCPHGQNDYLCDFQRALVYIFIAIV